MFFPLVYMAMRAAIEWFRAHSYASSNQRVSKMDVASFLQFPLPSPTESVFDRILTLGWYDGITSGLLCASARSSVFRFDILAWSPDQDQRIFALSPMSIAVFDEVVGILTSFELPKWPRWDCVGAWPRDMERAIQLSADLDQILAIAEKPTSVIETESMFETIFASRRLPESTIGLIPDHFEAYPHLDNYDYWRQYLGLPV